MLVKSLVSSTCDDQTAARNPHAREGRRRARPCCGGAAGGTNLAHAGTFSAPRASTTAGKRCAPHASLFPSSHTGTSQSDETLRHAPLRRSCVLGAKGFSCARRPRRRAFSHSPRTSHALIHLNISREDDLLLVALDTHVHST